MIAIRRLRAEMAITGIAVDALRARLVIAQMPIEQRIGNERAAGGDDVAATVLDRRLHDAARSKTTDTNYWNRKLGF